MAPSLTAADESLRALTDALAHHSRQAARLGQAAVDVPVLENDFDRDGSPEELWIAFPEGTATASVRPGEGGTSMVNVQLLPEAQTVLDERPDS